MTYIYNALTLAARFIVQATAEKQTKLQEQLSIWLHTRKSFEGTTAEAVAKVKLYVDTEAERYAEVTVKLDSDQALDLAAAAYMRLVSPVQRDGLVTGVPKGEIPGVADEELDTLAMAFSVLSDYPIQSDMIRRRAERMLKYKEALKFKEIEEEATLLTVLGWEFDEDRDKWWHPAHGHAETSQEALAFSA